MKDSKAIQETELQRVNRLNAEKLESDPESLEIAQIMLENLKRNILKDSQ